MRAFLRDLWALLRNHVRVLAGLGVALVILLLALNLGVSRIARQSSFCPTCHYMAPYVEQWKTSKHAGVDCIRCHPYGAGAVAASTIRYLSGAYNPRPRAEVDDKSCLAFEPSSPRLTCASITPCTSRRSPGASSSGARVATTRSSRRAT